MAPCGTKTASLDLEDALWAAANQLRSNMDAAEYKHVVLGLLFLKYVSDKFKARRTYLDAESRKADSDFFMPSDEARQTLLNDRDEHTAENVFLVPKGHRWSDLCKVAKQPTIGSRIDTAVEAIEQENPSLKGVLPKNFNRRELSPSTLGGLTDTFSRDDLAAEHAGMEVPGRAYEYFLAQFTSNEGKNGEEFYTPRSVIYMLVEMLRPYNGRVFDPCCGSNGMLVQSAHFVNHHDRSTNDISIFEQEQNPTTWRLAKMNLAIRGIEVNLGPECDGSFHDDKHPDLRTDFIMANPPFNTSTCREFSEIQNESLLRYQNRSLVTAAIVAELVKLAQALKAEHDRRAQTGFTDDELAFYDALRTNEPAVETLQDDTMKTIAHELTEIVRRDFKTDWVVKEQVRAKIRTTHQATAPEARLPARQCPWRHETDLEASRGREREPGLTHDPLRPRHTPPRFSGILPQPTEERRVS